MTSRSLPFEALWELPARTTALVCAGLILALAVVDALTPADLIVSSLFGVPLVIGAAARQPRLLWSLAALLVVLTYGSLLWGLPPTHSGVHALVLLNRTLSAVETLVIAGLLHVGIIAVRALEEQRQALEKQNDELETINQELGQREEEIVRQNEELQSQSEELERQSEELRITNDELANREKLLEQLLELSRSLTADLGRNDTLRKICEALGVLTEGNPSAIMEKRDSVLEVPCYHGFGPEGLESETLPFDRSFTALIMALGQTGYLEDTQMRPDLHFPRPKTGEAVRSVLAAPLRVQGRCIGTIEIYARQPQSWAERQIAMLESLAAQASISLQSTEQIEMIRQERRRFEAVFRTVPFGLFVADDAEGRQVRVNPSAAALFGVPLDENVALGSPVGDRLRRAFFRGDHPLAADQWPLVRALGGVEVQGEEMEVVLPHGKRCIVLVSAAPIYDGKGRVAGGVAAFADITTQKALQRELDVRRREAEEASVRKTRFLAAISHDIRTPVNAINLMAEVIRRSADNPAMQPQVPQLAQRLQANALSLADLVSDVLDLARFDSGKMDLQESEFSLDELLAEECRHLLPLAQDKQLELRLDPPERPIWLRTDRVKLARVIGNLLGNAIKFTPQGSVRVRAGFGPQRQVLMHFSDTGVGIPAEQQARIFDEFAQLRNPERDRNKGSGLGLAICKRLIDVIGGSLSVQSTVGQGSTFTVTLPASCVVLRLEAPPPAPAPPQPRQRLAGMRLLLVEDHAGTREVTARLLADEGATVAEAPDGQSALEQCGRGAWDVILLDMMLPDMDGREVLKRVQQQRPAGLKAVIVMTGDLTPERFTEVRELGADALIGKPIDVEKLMDTLRGLRSFGRG